MKRLLAIQLAVMAVTLSAIADTKTTRRSLHAATESTELVAGSASLTPAADSIAVTDYDKPLRSSQETLFITNNSVTSLKMVSLEITYLTVNGEMLHRRAVNLPCEIPPGQTRQLAFRAWDRQQAYYHHSTRVTPRSPKAIPYRIEIKVEGGIFDD